MPQMATPRKLQIIVCRFMRHRHQQRRGDLRRTAPRNLSAAPSLWLSPPLGENAEALGVSPLTPPAVGQTEPNSSLTLLRSRVVAREQPRETAPTRATVPGQRQMRSLGHGLFHQRLTSPTVAEAVAGTGLDGFGWSRGTRTEDSVYNHMQRCPTRAIAPWRDPRSGASANSATLAL